MVSTVVCLPSFISPSTSFSMELAKVLFKKVIINLSQSLQQTEYALYKVLHSISVLHIISGRFHPRFLEISLFRKFISSRFDVRLQHRSFSCAITFNVQIFNRQTGPINPSVPHLSLPLLDTLFLAVSCCIHPLWNKKKVSSNQR